MPVRLLILLIPVQTEPAQSFENGVNRCVRVSLHVRVVEPQHHGPAISPGIEPVNNERASAAHVQKAGRRWRKAHPRAGRHPSARAFNKTVHEKVTVYDVTGVRKRASSYHLSGRPEAQAW